MKQRSSCSNFSCLLAGLFLVGLAVLVWATFTLPARAEAHFGPPSPRLGFGQRLRLSAELLWQKEALTTPADLAGSPRAFSVAWGETPAAIAARLEYEGLIRSPRIFISFLQYTGMDTTLQAGEYTLSPAMTSLEIARALQDATPNQITFTVLAGWRMEEIAASLPTSGLNISPEAFLLACRSRPPGYNFLAELPSQATLEGFLAAGSYPLSRGTTAVELITALLESFRGQLSPEMQQGFAHQGLNVFQAVTLASIIEREAVLDEEMPIIASVFFNRLAVGMPLESDPTVQYALGYNTVQQTWWTNPLSREDFEVASPYNTYRNNGLPPGPIANPGPAALQAVAFPARTPYYYFRAACDGSGRHLFAATFKEHLRNDCP
jgi:UPF0755 protein